MDRLEEIRKTIFAGIVDCGHTGTRRERAFVELKHLIRVVEQLRGLGIRTKSLLERAPGLNCDVHFFRGWTITRIDIQEEWGKALKGD